MPKKRTSREKKVYRRSRQLQREAGGKDKMTLGAARRAVERGSRENGAAPEASSRKPPPPDAWAKATGDFGRQLADAILAYAAPILWGAGEPAGGMNDDVRSGTTFFVDTGEALFGVTAGHVYEAHKARADATGVLCQIGLGEAGKGSRVFDLRERVIDHSQSPDIATYRISPEEIARTGARVFKAPGWPPKPPKVDAGVAFVGYPGSGREVVAPRRIAWDNFHGSAFVESVSDERITCPIPREWIVPIKGMRFPAPGEDTAGLSGGPLVCFNQGAVLSWRLVGVICDGGGGAYEGEGGPFLDMVVGARVDLINADGTINELPHPRRRTSR